MAKLSAILQSVSSVLFRILSYIYLRIIPARPGYIVIPALFTVYALSFATDYLFGVPQLIDINVEKDEITDVKAIPVQGDDDNLKVEVEVAKTEIVHVTAAPHDPPPSLSTYLFTLPTKATLPKLVGFLINAVILVMSLDFLGRPLIETEEGLAFTRVGAVYSDAAKIVVRYPNVEGGVRILWKQTDGLGSLGPTTSDESGWIEGPVLDLLPEHDWLAVAKLDALWASTRYQYRLAAAANSTLLPYPATPIAFRTFPDARIPGTHFKFVASSCILPNFPYVPFRASTHIKGFELLNSHLFSLAQLKTPAVSKASSVLDPSVTPTTPSPQVLAETEYTTTEPATEASESSELIPLPPTPEATSAPLVLPVEDEETTIQAPLSLPLTTTSEEPKGLPLADVSTEFLLLLGDFVYADVPFSVGDDKDAYNQLYRRVYASKEFRNIYEKLPIFNIYDDHEIENNYNGFSNDSRPLFQNASSAYSLYNGQANYDSKGLDVNGRSPYYFDFNYGDVAFFVLDTRRYRSVQGVNTTEGEVTTILGEKQFSDLRRWLVQVNSTATFKFIVSSVPLSALWAGVDGQTDTWAGAEQERREFLDSIEYVPNVIVISGDRHEFAAVEYITGTYEFSISPLSQFYVPFVRTFWPKNGRTRQVKSVVQETDAEGKVQSKEIIKEVPEEKILKYLPHGNYKWATFEVDTTDAEKPTVKLELSIEGAKAWEYTITGKPIRYTGGTALGSQIADTISGGLKGVLDSISKLGKIFG